MAAGNTMFVTVIGNVVPKNIEEIRSNVFVADFLFLYALMVDPCWPVGITLRNRLFCNRRDIRITPLPIAMKVNGMTTSTNIIMKGQIFT